MLNTADSVVPDVGKSKLLSDSRLEMSFKVDPEQRSYLSKQYFTYPFHVCRAQYMDKSLPGMATMYLQSCSGGVFKGDRLSTVIEASEGAQVHVTTQASTIIHRMEDDFANQTIDIKGAKGSFIEYMPESTILFPEAKLRSTITITRDSGCDVIVCDSFLAHDPEGTKKSFSWLKNELIVQNLDGNTDVVDRFEATGEQFRSGESSGGNPYTVHGTFAVISNRVKTESLLEALRTCLPPGDDVFSGSSSLPNKAGCWVRYLAVDGIAADKYVQSLWFVAREALTGHPPSKRRK
jgi:urease accessory protein